MGLDSSIFVPPCPHLTGGHREWGGMPGGGGVAGGRRVGVHTGLATLSHSARVHWLRLHTVASSMERVPLVKHRHTAIGLGLSHVDVILGCFPANEASIFVFLVIGKAHGHRSLLGCLLLLLLRQLSVFLGRGAGVGVLLSMTV